jgi:hypothetical protein
MAELQMLLSDVLDTEKGKLNDQQLKELASDDVQFLSQMLRTE